jgi:uncharacterized protein YndB with AHSA1/START domain
MSATTGWKLALALCAAVLALAGVVAVQPSSFAIERSATIQAPPERVYSHIESLRAMDVWSPWTKMDPGMETVYEGPEAGVDARSSWEGPQMGKGRITITAVEPGRRVEMRLEMLTPMPATNRVVFTLTPARQATDVTWRMEGSHGFVGKAIALFADMDAMVGAPFEQGLASLEQLAEAEAAVDLSAVGR